MSKLPVQKYSPDGAALSFEDWLQLTFVTDPKYGEADDLEERGSDAIRLTYAEYTLWTWEDPQTWMLDRFKIFDYGRGIWYQRHIYADLELPVEIRERGWMALRNLFQKVFIPNVSDTLSDLLEQQGETEWLNWTCFLWWKASPYHPSNAAYDAVDHQHFLDLCRDCLFSGKPAMQESAILGLSFSSNEKPYPPALELLKEFVAKGVAARPELIPFANRAIAGEVL